MRPEIVRNDVRGTGFGEADAFGGPWLVEVMPFATNLAHTLHYRGSVHVIRHLSQRMIL
jgi:hypothetical protein